MGESTQGELFFVIETDQTEALKLHAKCIIKIDQSQMSNSKIASKDKIPLMAK